MRLPAPRGVFGQDLLAAEGGVPSAPADRVAADVPVRVPDVVPVFLVEGVVGHELERLAPEDQAVVEAEPDALQEEGVLQTAVVFEVRIPSEGGV